MVFTKMLPSSWPGKAGSTCGAPWVTREDEVGPGQEGVRKPSKTNPHSLPPLGSTASRCPGLRDAGGTRCMTGGR